MYTPIQLLTILTLLFECDKFLIHSIYFPASSQNLAGEKIPLPHAEGVDFGDRHRLQISHSRSVAEGRGR